MTLPITHSACLEHLTPPGHPERPDRLRAIEQVLEHEKFTFLVREQCPRAELEIVALCHPWEYIERIRRAVPQTGLVQLDDDTVLSAGSFRASLSAANTTTSSMCRCERATAAKHFARLLTSQFFQGFKISRLTLSSSQLVSTHTGLTLWQTSSSRRRISAGRPTRLWTSLIEEQRAR